MDRLNLMKLVSAPETLNAFDADFDNCRIRYGDMKNQLAEDMVRFISPIREKSNTIRNDQPYMKTVMEQGATKARASASVTLKLVREAMGLKYY